MPTDNNQPDPMRFAERFNEVLSARGLSKRGINAKLASEYDVSAPTVTQWRQGKYVPEPSKVRKMAREFKVPFEWLYWGEGEPPQFVGTVVARLTTEKRVLYAEGFIAALCMWIRETIPVAVPNLIEHVEASAKKMQADPGGSVFSVALDALHGRMGPAVAPHRASRGGDRAGKPRADDP